LNDGAQCVVDAITDDQYLDLVDALRLHAFHRERKRRGMVMRRNQHAGAEHGKSLTVREGFLAPFRAGWTSSVGSP
jgi:hypothetical protein